MIPGSRPTCCERVEARIPATAPGVSDPLTGIVIGYVAAAVTSLGMLLILLKSGW
jgi:hypothetical protein